MKNLVFNLRTAKAQAEGCAKVTKSSRMAKVLTTLTLLLTLGFGQAWGAVGFESSDCGIKYSHNGGSDTEWNFSGQSAQTKTLAGNTSSLWLKQWFAKMYQNEDGTIYGQNYHKFVYKIHRTAASAGTTGFTTLDANWWEWGNWDDGGYRHPKGGHNNENINLLDGLGSGKYTMTFYFQHNGNSTYKSKQNTLKWTYNIVPNVSSFAVTPNNVVSGTGTSGDPYIITYGQDMTLTVSGTKASTDANSSLYAKFGSSDYGSTLTKTFTVTTSLQNVTVTAKYYNSADDLSGTESSTTIYYKTVATPTINLSAPSSGVRGESVTLTAATSNASTPTIYYEYSTSSTFASSITEINHTTNTSQSWTIPSGISGTTYYLRAKMQVSSTWYYSSILTFTVYGKKTIHVKNTNGWASMYLYLYSDSGEKEAWHGSTTGISSYGGQWKTVVLTSQWPYFILNDNGSNQIKGDKTYKYADMTDGNCYAISSGTGNALTLSSATCPTAPTSVTTTATPTSITNTGMTVHGNIGGNGNDNITDYGFYYGTTSTPGTKAQVGTTNKTGAISKALTGLTAGTTYYFRTYATNGQGTTYGTVRSYKIPYSVTVSKSTGCESITPSAGSYYYNAGFTVTAVAATGYTFNAWSKTNGNLSGASSPSTGTNTVTFTPTANSATITATYTPKTTTVTLQNTGQTGYGSGSNRSVTGTYDAAMPTVAAGNLPTAANGYAFMGYWDAAGGEGTQYYNANGTSARTWDKTESTATLYAYFKKAEITDITLNNTMFDPVDAGETGWVIANPTIEPTPVLPVKICWELLYDNDNPVPAGHEAQAYTEEDTKPNQVRFSITGLAAGEYKIKATLRTGDDCSGGTLLSEREVSFTIASGYTVTIQYKDTEGNTIAPSTTSPGKATDWTSISAPTIVGYNFSTWVPGDGITLQSSATTNNNKFQATFNGTLTAQYTKKGIIYFKNTLGWSDVYVNFMSGDYWDTSNGSGNSNKYYSKNNQMTLMPGTTDVYYFEYSGSTTAYVSFTSKTQTSAANFWAEDGINVVFPTRPDASDTDRAGEGFGYNAGTPMFVPLSGQTKVDKNGSKAHYYNKGHWVDYNPISHNTGYTLEIYNHANADGSREVLKTVKFYENGEGALEATVDLDAATTYAVKFLRDNNMRYTNVGGTNLKDGTSLKFEYNADNWAARTLVSTAAGSYVFKIRCNSDGYLYLTATFPAAANDFQILYNDNAEWSLGSAHNANWVHPSRIIRARENGVDTISFFVAKDNTPILKARKVNSINASTGAITWGSLNINGDETQSLSVDSSAVYNFKVTQGATAGDIASIEYIGPYTGNYYIRCNALNSNWDNYTTDGDHRMTYSSFSESAANSFGEKYSHYKAKWCPRNTNIAFCIANDYSPCITDTLIQDVPNTYENTESDGTLKYEKSGSSMKYNDNNAYLDRYSANVRFMWDRKTNKISRAYISAATSGLAQFLVLRAGQELHNENNVAISSSPANSVLLSDNENWIYEARLMIKPGTRFKLYACYAKNPVDPASAQYFRGAYDSDNFTSDDNSVILIGGESVDYQLARIVYDFKTNRLIAAWMPSGEVSGTNEINADVMIIRDHQESARCITFADASANLSAVKTVYGVMRFNRWILNNRQYPENQNKAEADLAHHPPLSVGQQKSTYERRLYFISFPFDVLVGDIFGFGTYGQYWVIQYYDGLNRAKKGYWMDSKPNWKYVSPTEVAQGYKLEKNQGYILELNLSAMAADNTTFWSNGISTIELYFPSTVNQETLKQTNCTIPALSDEYKCTINRGTTEGDRRVKDSYWRCIGVPSYNLYNSTLKDGSGNAITWKTDYTWYNDEREFPFIYMWNKTDNTLTPQATSAFTFQPMHAYLTQIKSAIVWTAVSAKPSSIVARRARKEATKEYNWRIELRQDTTFLDQTYVRMTDLEQVTDSFDFGQDLIKELNSRSNIYTFIGYEKVAANSMTLHTDQTTVIPVGANITTEGDYTFALPDGADGIGVTLIDEETGTRTNLSAGMDYTVYLEKGTHDNRFWLEISPVKGTETGIDPGVDARENGVRKVMIDGILYIVRDGKMYDATGKRVE